MHKKVLNALVVGGVTVDHIFYNSSKLTSANKLENLVGKIDFEHSVRSIGGGGGNVATSLTRLGLSVTLCSRIGNDLQGEQVKEIFVKEGIDLGNLQIDYEFATGSAFIAQLNDNHLIMAHRASNKNLDLKLLDLSDLVGINLLYISSLSGESIKDLPYLISHLKAMNPDIFIAMNPGGEQLKEANIDPLTECFPLVDLLLINKKESIVLHNNIQTASPCRKQTASRIETSLASYALRLGIKFLCITKDKEGAVLMAKDEIVSCPAKKTIYKNGLGAGDAFGSTLAYGLTKGFGKRQSLSMASLNAASVVSMVDTSSGLLRSNIIS